MTLPPCCFGFRKRSDGDIQAIGNRGLILTSFHWAGQLVLEPSLEERSQWSNLAAQGQQAPPPTGFVGELTRFACCDTDFTTHITGGQNYVAEVFYQESGVNYMKVTGVPGGPAGQIVANCIKTDTTDRTHLQSVIDSWDGLYWMTGGDTDFQGNGSAADVSPVTIKFNGSTAAGHGTRAVFLMQLPWENPITFSIGEDTNVEMTRIGNVWSKLTMSCEDPEDEWHPDSEAHMVQGFDALRRLARLDLQTHYPSLGVLDTCGP